MTPPIAWDDFATTFDGDSVSIQVLSDNGNGADSDVDGTLDPATVRIVSPPQGTVVNQGNGTLLFTPQPGFFGVDTFTYDVQDDDGTFSNLATVRVSVNATFIDADFDADTSGFVYMDDLFLNTEQPVYASGTHETAGGNPVGALRVTVGGIESAVITDMSGGWQTQLEPAAPAIVTVSFSYNLTQSPGYEDDEFSQVLFAVDGTLYGEGSNQHVAQIFVTAPEEIR